MSPTRPDEKATATMTMPADRLLQIDACINAARRRVEERTASGAYEPEVRTLIHAAEAMRLALTVADHPQDESLAEPEANTAFTTTTGYDVQAEMYTDLCDVVERAWMHLPVEREPGEIGGTSDYAREAANRILGIVEHAARQFRLLGAGPDVGVPAGEDEILQVLEERDEAREAADQLTDVIGDITGVDMGEHSNLNEPWVNAVRAGTEYLASVDFEYGVRWVRHKAMHRDAMTEEQAKAFFDPADWQDFPRPVFEMFEMVRRRHGQWQVVP